MSESSVGLLLVVHDEKKKEREDRRVGFQL